MVEYTVTKFDVVHIVTRMVDGKRYRYATLLSDKSFDVEVQRNLAEYEIGGLSGWKFVHIPVVEWNNGSPRKDIIMGLPIYPGRIEDDLIEDILKQHPNHEPCSWCSDHMDTPPRGYLCTGYIPAHKSKHGRGQVWNGYLCEQCADELDSVRFK